MGNILNVVYEEGNTSYRASEKIWQYNYGQILRLQGFHLPKATEVQFSYTERGGESVTRIATSKDNVADVVIPDSMLENGDISQDYKLYAFVYVEDGTTGTTEYKIIISVRSRPKPEQHESPETEEIFKETVRLVNKYADEAEASKQSAEQSANESAESAKSAKQSAADAETTKEKVETLGKKLEDAKDAAIEDVNTLKQNSLDAIEAEKVKAVETVQEQETSSKNAIKAYTDGEIERANVNASEAKNQLDSSINVAGTAKTVLDTSTQNAVAAKAALDGSIASADSSKKILDTSTENASKTKTALDNSVAEANTSKSNLDKTNETANNLDTSLQEKITEGNKLKEDITAEGQKQLSIVEQASAEIVADRDKIEKLANNVIVQTVQGRDITLEDSANFKLQGLKVFGESNQQTTKGLNLLDLSKCDLNYCTSNGDKLISNISNYNYASINVRYLNVEQNDTLYFKCNNPTNNNLSIVVYGSFTDNVDRKEANSTTCVKLKLPTLIKLNYIELRFNRRSDRFTDITSEFSDFILSMVEPVNYEPYTGMLPSPSPNYPQEIFNTDNIVVSIDDKNITIPYELRSVTLADGSIIRDEVDYGSKKFIQRIYYKRLTGDMNIKLYEINDYKGFLVECLPFLTYPREGYCNYYSIAFGVETRENIVIGGKYNNRNCVCFFSNHFYDSNLEDKGLENFRSWLDSNNVYIQTYYDVPIEIPLTDEDLAAYRALETTYPTTHISNDQNAEMEVSYVADTKTYIDNKFKELADAIVASASEAE